MTTTGMMEMMTAMTIGTMTEGIGAAEAEVVVAQEVIKDPLARTLLATSSDG
jgi:hypothetical protein